MDGNIMKGQEKTFEGMDRTAHRFSRQVEDLDLPGSVGISEPSFATHLQPLTRCH